MGRESKQNELAAFTPDPLEDLTIQDALIISAVYAMHAETDKCEQIGTLAQNHPLFVEKPEDTSARVNKYTNLMQGANTLKPVEAVARQLEPKHRKQAFEFAMETALAGAALTEDKKKKLRTLGEKLALDNQFVDQKLASFDQKTG